MCNLADFCAIGQDAICDPRNNFFNFVNICFTSSMKVSLIYTWSSDPPVDQVRGGPLEQAEVLLRGNQAVELGSSQHIINPLIHWYLLWTRCGFGGVGGHKFG
jgi:hypothetical protein